ncbi:MAG: 5-dehydro-4-deoxy-D-glucuronate isomerase [Propionibacteriaceae bacterium]|jgi:4-deoxy-L-threo-5-hexosulose-uronate ketol-isomerase|nr:5-dehydro-4-deoxy-D-glucuronate isomerase [Propionibacteriaceae bacterium]
MEFRDATASVDYTGFDTEALRQRFLLENIFIPGEITLSYTLEDRIVLGGAVPLDQPLELTAPAGLYADYFCQRRELTLTNLGGAAVITVDGVAHDLGREDVIYIAMGSREIQLASVDPSNPALLYVFSATAHSVHPTTVVRREDAMTTEAGADVSANHRMIRKYVHMDGARSDQIVLGITSLEPGSVWNTMPCHTHIRRTEIYLYFGLGDADRVVHLMGRPDQTRDLIMAENQVVISPAWSIHTGVGTKNYAFIWAMAGENQEFSDMQVVDTTNLR